MLPMQAPIRPSTPESPSSDYSQAVIVGAIILMGMWLVMFVGGIILSGSVPAFAFGLFDFQLVAIFGLAALTLLAGVFLLLRPPAVHKLAQRLGRLSSRASSPQEAAVWCWYASAHCLLLGLLLALDFSGHLLSGLAFGLILSGLLIGLMLAREVVLLSLRHR
jgi:hypothetical protein